MTKFKLINKATKEEHICTKKEVLGQIYYETEKEVIATEGHSIDGIGKVIDEVDKKSWDMAESMTKLKGHYEKIAASWGFKNGYTTSQKSHPFSEQDVESFGQFCINKISEFLNSDESEDKSYSMAELLSIWKENHKLTVLYYE